jgi:beta-galactosidase
MVPFVEGTNKLQVLAHRGSVTANDQIEFLYQTRTWGTPATLKLTELHRDADKVTVEAKLYDAQGVLCLDARNRVRFTLAGNGALIDNLGTPTGSRLVELCNGRAEISLRRAKAGQATVGISSVGIADAFCLIG